MAKKRLLVLIAPKFLEQIDLMAQVEHRTRTDLVREAVRRYIEQFKRSRQHK